MRPLARQSRGHRRQAEGLSSCIPAKPTAHSTRSGPLAAIADPMGAAVSREGVAVAFRQIPQDLRRFRLQSGAIKAGGGRRARNAGRLPCNGGRFRPEYAGGRRPDRRPRRGRARGHCCRPPGSKVRNLRAMIFAINRSEGAASKLPMCSECGLQATQPRDELAWTLTHLFLCDRCEHYRSLHSSP